MQVDRLHVEEAVADGDHQQVAPQHARAGAVPQRELLADRWVLVDASFNLDGAEDQLLARQLIGLELPIIGRVVAGGEPGDHVIAPGRRVGLDEQKLRFGLARKWEDDVVRLHPLRLPFQVDLFGDGPQIFLVVEDLYVIHVVGQILARLDLEEILGIADVGLQVLGHLRKRLEKAGEGLRIALNNGVVLGDEVEVDRTVIRIYRHLGRVANVIDPGRYGVAAHCGGLAVGEVIAHRIGIQHPHQPPVGDDQIGIVILPEEGGDLRHALLDLPVEHDARLGRDVFAEHQVQVGKAQGKGQPVQVAAQGDPALAGIAAIDVLLAARVVKLRQPAGDVHLIVGQLAIINLRPGHLQLHLALRRQIPDVEKGPPFCRHLVHRVHDDAIAVRELEPLVDPRPVFQPLLVHFARRQHHLPGFALDHVPVYVHVKEGVVGAQFLELGIAVEQGPVIPQTDIPQRRLVVLQLVFRDGGIGFQHELLDGAEAERFAREGNVVGQIGRFASQLVGLHGVALQQRRVEDAPNRGDGEPQDNRPKQRARVGPPRVEDEARGDEHQGHSLNAQNRQRGLHVGVAGAKDEVARRKQQIVGVKPVAGSPQQSQESQQQRALGAYPHGQGRPAPHAAAQPCHVGRRKSQADTEKGQENERYEPALHEAQDRQGKQVEADVVGKERVVEAIGDLVEIAQKHLPACGGDLCEDKGQEEGDAGHQPAYAALRCRQRAPRPPEQPSRQPPVERQKERRDDEEDEKGGDIRPPLAQPDVTIADRAKPEPLGVGVDRPAETDQHDQDQDGQPEPAPPPQRLDRADVAWWGRRLLFAPPARLAGGFLHKAAKCFRYLVIPTAHLRLLPGLVRLPALRRQG